MLQVQCALRRWDFALKHIIDMEYLVILSWNYNTLHLEGLRAGMEGKKDSVPVIWFGH